MPRKTIIVDRVAMKELMRVVAISRPLRKPRTRPATTPTSAEAQMLSPALVASRPVTTPVTA